jgi:hypothetical protein
VGKKLQNPLLSTTKIVFWGKHMASKNHLLLILEKINKDQGRPCFPTNEPGQLRFA